MKPRISKEHPLYALFSNLIHEALVQEAPRLASRRVHEYLSSLLLDFTHTDSVFALKDANGHPIRSVIEMTAEGDIRLNADSFERERQVHKFIGDYILFWSGMFPDYLSRLKLGTGQDLRCDYATQGKHSYWVVSTFDYDPFTEESHVFRSLSNGFEGYSEVLKRVAHDLPFRAA